VLFAAGWVSLDAVLVPLDAAGAGAAISCDAVSGAAVSPEAVSVGLPQPIDKQQSKTTSGSGQPLREKRIRTAARRLASRTATRSGGCHGRRTAATFSGSAIALVLCGRGVLD
jgi:hypothetical protein